MAKGEQRQPNLLKLNPSGRIPVLVNHDAGKAEQFILTQSIAILQYLAEKTQQLLPVSLLERAEVYQWMHFHAVDIGATIFNAFYLRQRCSPRQPQAAELLKQHVHELYHYFDQHLAEHEFLANASYSIADIAMLPAALDQQQQLIEYPNLSRWLQQLKKRPAVIRGMAETE